MKIHIVQKGDTLWEIAKKYQVDFEELKQLNSHLASPDMIMPGMKIRIPGSSKKKKQEPVMYKSDQKQEKKIEKSIIKKTQEVKKEVKPKAQEEVKTKVKEEVKPKEKFEKPKLPELPKLPIEEPLTLPILDIEKDQYETAVFPEVSMAPKEKEKKEKPKQAVEKAQPQKPKPKTPQYEKQMEYPQAMPAYYPYCYPYYLPVPMPEQTGCGCCGQQYQMPISYPYDFCSPYQTMPYYPQQNQVQSMMPQQMYAYPQQNQVQSMMSQQMLSYPMNDGQMASPFSHTMQTYPYNESAKHYRTEQKIYPKPPSQSIFNKADDYKKGNE